MTPVLNLRLAADGVDVAVDIPLEPIQITRLTGPVGFRRDEVLDMLVRLTVRQLDTALRQPKNEGAGSARDE